MADAFIAERRYQRAAIEIVGLSGFVAGLGGVMFGDAPLALAGFGIAALATTDVVVQWAHVTIPVGVGLIFMALGVYLIR